MNTPPNAVTASADALIRAPVATVWSVLTAIQDWPSWNDEISQVEMSGPLAPGTEFRWKAGKMHIVSVLTDVEEPRRIAWRGKTLGIRAVHEYTLEVRDGGVLVQTRESFEGLLPRLMRRSTENMLKKTLQRGVELLKKECERLAAESGGLPTGSREAH